MNLNKLFELQAKLDDRIVHEKGLEGQDLLPQKILALQVELGELANEWRGFKFWSEDQEPRYTKRIKCPSCNGNGKVDEDSYFCCDNCDNPYGGLKTIYPLLEEYVDCLHFILSIGLDYGYRKYSGQNGFNYAKDKDLTTQFTRLLKFDLSKLNYPYFVSKFLALGEMLGFTREEIEQAYLDKNEINHERQDSNY
jgi:dimeric dUTPase (all-alpha-NTP-PPase superfamily)